MLSLELGLPELPPLELEELLLLLDESGLGVGTPTEGDPPPAVGMPSVEPAPLEEPLAPPELLAPPADALAPPL